MIRKLVRDKHIGESIPSLLAEQQKKKVLHSILRFEI